MWSYNPYGARSISLGSSLFARHYLGNHYYFLFLLLLRCFSSEGWLPPYGGWYTFSVPGCPIRKSADISLVCSSPRLIAAYHVLHRLSEPRHPPYALKCFKRVITVTRHLQLKKIFLPICQRAPLCFQRELTCVSLLLMFWLWTNRPLCQHHFTIKNFLWRISESNRWPLACKASALANWANPPNFCLGLIAIS